jgi:polyhydroxybutyrate depolymerase
MRVRAGCRKSVWLRLDANEVSTLAASTIRRLIGASLILLVLAPGPAVAAETPRKASGALAPGNYSLAVAHDALERSYLVHMPPQTTTGAPLAVVLNLHGATSNAEQQEGYSRMDGAADRHGFIAVYPNGTGRFGNHYTWNAGFCCGYAMLHNIDDVGFILALLDDLAARTPIDRRRVYATGLSNGAMMSYRLAAQASTHIAAIAPVAGSLVIPAFGPEHPVPVMAFNSLDDPYLRYTGGYGNAVSGLFHHNFGNPGVEKTLARWAKFDACPAQPQVGPTLKGKPGTKQEGITVTRYIWAPCRAGTEVVLWKFTGSGHVWPGGVQDHFVGFLGRGTDPDRRQRRDVALLQQVPAAQRLAGADLRPVLTNGGRGRPPH